MLIKHPDYDGGRCTFFVVPGTRNLIRETYRALSTLYPRSVARGTAIDFLRRLESIETEMSGLCYRASFYRKGNK